MFVCLCLHLPDAVSSICLCFCHLSNRGAASFDISYSKHHDLLSPVGFVWSSWPDCQSGRGRETKTTQNTKDHDYAITILTITITTMTMMTMTITSMTLMTMTILTMTMMQLRTALLLVLRLAPAGYMHSAPVCSSWARSSVQKLSLQLGAPAGYMHLAPAGYMAMTQQRIKGVDQLRYEWQNHNAPFRA